MQGFAGIVGVRVVGNQDAEFLDRADTLVGFKQGVGFHEMSVGCFGVFRIALKDEVEIVDGAGVVAAVEIDIPQIILGFGGKFRAREIG